MATTTTVHAAAARFPILLKGAVVRGFGRGSKELGCPTANLPIEPYRELLETSIATGIYYGWGSIRSIVYKMVMSIGWNPRACSPFEKNAAKSDEDLSVKVFLVFRFCLFCLENKEKRSEKQEKQEKQEKRKKHEKTRTTRKTRTTTKSSSS